MDIELKLKKFGDLNEKAEDQLVVSRVSPNFVRAQLLLVAVRIAFCEANLSCLSAD